MLAEDDTLQGNKVDVEFLEPVGMRTREGTNHKSDNTCIQASHIPYPC